MCAVLSEAYGTAAVKKLNVLSGINDSRRVKSIQEMQKEAIQKCTDLIKTQVHYLTWSDKANQPARPMYVEVSVRLHEAVPRKGPELWPNKWFFHHDWSTLLSALSHRLWEKRCCWIGTAPIFTRLGMWFFPKLMSTLKG